MATTTWTQTAGMTSDEDVDNVDSFAEQAEASKDAAAASATAAASSESAASASATSASASATTATTKAAEASTSATNAATSASSASSSATSATASETAAAASKNAAAASATAAAASETAAASSETAAAASETAAATSETNAATSATSASTSATTASTAATTASTAATNAATSETNAATSATTASTAATNAATSETNAATSATNAATSETNAATSETNASTSATSASTSASAASTSATAAAASQSAAAASAASAASAYDTFDDRYLGSKTADPTVDNDGDALVAGALYFNSTANEMRVYDGANWIAATSAGNVSLLEYKYTATSGQTIFSGADDSLNTLSYTQDNLIVTLNGVVLENGTDYTATTGTSVVLSSGAATSDELNVIAFKSFTTADMVSSANGGTFYNDIDVQGTVTADGLTVDGNATINDNFPYILLNESDTTDLNTRISVGAGYFNLNTLDDAYTVAKQRFRLDNSTGDISFYEDTGTTAKFFWDASAESLGIGTSSPIFGDSAQGLEVKRSGGNVSVRVNYDGSAQGQFTATNSSIKLETRTSGIPLVFGTAAVERMRIDSSGNLMVGKTAVGYATDGFEARSGGQVAISDTSTVPLLVNINDTGNVHGIMNLYRNGATVGSFKVSYGDLIVGTGDTGIKFYDSSNALFPVNQSTGANRDAEVNLGISSVRFKDLYLSGGVYLGGTGSANKLDDYEEGTFTPSVAASTTDPTVTYVTQAGRYTKIGNVVNIRLFIQISAISGGSGSVEIANLPFTINNSGIYSGFVIGNMRYIDIPSNVVQVNVNGGGGASAVTLRTIFDNADWGTIPIGNVGSSFSLYLSGTYEN